MALRKFWQWVPPHTLNFLLQQKPVRKIVMRKAEKEHREDTFMGPLQ